MARNRMLKAEYWSDETMAGLPFLTQLLFMALWNFADDAGRGKAVAKGLNGFAFPHRSDVSDALIEESLQALADAGRIELYVVGAARYYQVVHWSKHQCINRPTPSIIPESPGEAQQRGNRSLSMSTQVMPPVRDLPDMPNESASNGNDALTEPLVSAHPLEKNGTGDESTPPRGSSPIDRGAVALLHAFRSVRYPGKAGFLQGDWSAFRANLRDLARDGRTPDEMATVTRAAMARWGNVGMVTVRSVARNFEALLEPVCAQRQAGDITRDNVTRRALERWQNANVG